VSRVEPCLFARSGGAIWRISLNRVGKSGGNPRKQYWNHVFFRRFQSEIVDMGDRPVRLGFTSLGCGVRQHKRWEHREVEAQGLAFQLGRGVTEACLPP
jgi:hypothetical protein